MTLIPFSEFEKKDCLEQKKLESEKEKKLMMVEEVPGTENCFKWLFFVYSRDPHFRHQRFFGFSVNVCALPSSRKQAANGCRPLA